jgi:hypothetical protein
LKADGSVDSSTFIAGSGVANQLTFWNGTGSVTGSSGLTYVDATGAMSLIKTQNAPTYLEIKNLNTSISALSVLNLTSSAGILQSYKGNSSSGVFSISSGTDGVIYNNSGNLAFINPTSGKFLWGISSSSVTQMTLTSAGRLLLGTTTESTFLLDVNATARVSGDLSITSIINGSIPSSSSTYCFNVSNNSGNLLFRVNNNASRVDFLDGNLVLNTGNTINSVSHIGMFIGTSTIYGSTGGANGGQYFGAVDNGGNGARYMVGHGTKGLKIELLPTGTWETSALLQVISTTRGFLPPRMTSTEKSAITPATGLMVYDTTQNSINVYDGATWRSDEDTITTNRQTASYSLVLADRGKLVEMNVASANTLTIPLNSSIAFPIGSKIDVTQYGAGATTITATGGVTIRSFTSFLKIAGQYAACTLVKIGTDEWYCYGNLIA